MESIVSLVLVGTVAVTISGLVLSSLLTSSVARETSEQTVAATERMEALLGQTFESLAMQPGGSTTSSVSGYSTDPYEGDPDRYVRWEIVEDNYQFIHITVVSGWRSTTVASAREVRLETYRKKSE